MDSINAAAGGANTLQFGPQLVQGQAGQQQSQGQFGPQLVQGPVGQQQTQGQFVQQTAHGQVDPMMNQQHATIQEVGLYTIY